MIVEHLSPKLKLKFEAQPQYESHSCSCFTPLYGQGTLPRSSPQIYSTAQFIPPTPSPPNNSITRLEVLEVRSLYPSVDHLLTYPPTHTRSPCLSIKAAHALCLSPELVVALHSHIHTCSTYVHIHDFSSHGIIQHWLLYDLATHSILTSRGYQ